MNDRLLSIYVEDHVALSLGGVRLAKRCLGTNRESELGRFLERLVPELAEDREMLLEIAGRLRKRPSLAKQGILFAGELAGRLKLNGRLLGYSNLSRLEELEVLLAGAEARLGLWRLLEHLARRDPRLGELPLERLRERAERHREALERFRMRAGAWAFLGEAQVRASEPAGATSSREQRE